MGVAPQLKNRLTANLSISKDFSKFPAGRYVRDGEFNGTRFRKDFLAPRLRALGESERLIVSFDGVAGFGSSFLEEAFGGLVRDEGMSKVFLDQKLEIQCGQEDLRDFASLAQQYIEDAAKAVA